MKTMLILLMLANAGDATLTAYNRTQPSPRETNPLFRPVFQQGPAAIGTAFCASSTAEWWGIRRVERRHRRLAKVMVIGGLTIEAWAIATSARGARGR